MVGSHLLVELVQKNTSVTAIYRNSEKIRTVRKIFDYYLKDQSETLFKRVNWVSCDILDVVDLEHAMRGHKVVYHCAAIVSFKRKDFSRMMKVNRYGTANIVNLCLHLGVEKLCHVSSTAAVGNKDIPEDQLVDEEGKWLITDETSGYSITKYSAEKEVWRGIEEGLNAVIVNPSVILGAGNWEESSLIILRTVDKGLRFYSPGSNAFVDARDVARIMVLLVEKDVRNQRFLCVGENAHFRTLLGLIAQKLDKKPPAYQVSPVLMGIAWRLSVFWSAITFSSPTITKSSARNAFKHIKFSNEKVRKELNYTFYSLVETVENAVDGRIR